MNGLYNGSFISSVEPVHEDSLNYKFSQDEMAGKIMGVPAHIPAQNLFIDNPAEFISVPVYIPSMYTPVKTRPQIVTGSSVPWEKMELKGDGVSLNPQDFEISKQFFGDWANLGY